MGVLQQLVIDVWSLLSHKSALGDGRTPPDDRAWSPPTWVPEEHGRRLRAYTILAAYYLNTARIFRSGQDRAGQGDIREYGDAALLVHTVADKILGEGQEIVVDGAEHADDEIPEEATPEKRAKLQTRIDAGKAALELQEWLREWWDLEQGEAALTEVEHNAAMLGDGVYALGWDPDKGRVRLRTYDPDCYFPAEGYSREFPRRVHIAWQYEIEDDESSRELLADLQTRYPALDVTPRAGRVLVQRITWELVPLAAPAALPWGTATETCLMTDALYPVDLAGRRRPDELDPSTAAYRRDESGDVRGRDLGVDFIPVVHITNNVPGKHGWGTSTLSWVAQILDDLAESDTQLAQASATTGSPPITISGATLGDNTLTYAPGEVLEVGDGEVTVIDTANSLDALLKRIDALKHRLSENVRVPDSILGRVSPEKVPSGVTLLISFAPLAGMIKNARLARRYKYRLLYKFAHRMALAARGAGVPQAEAVADLVFGPYLPQDLAGVADLVTQLLNPASGRPAISLETAVTMLADAGIPIEDAAEEVRRILVRDYPGAVQLLDATGDEQAVRDYLTSGAPDLSGPPPAPAPQPETGPPGGREE